MWKRLCIFFVCIFITSFAMASEPKITETETGVVVEYTGEPEKAIKQSDKCGNLGDDRSRFLCEEIDRLQKECDVLLNFTGKEPVTELERRRALAGPKVRLMEKYSEEWKYIIAKKRYELNRMKGE